MPSLGADMEAGTLTRWLVRPGDAVSRGDVVATVETDKADIDVEIWESGTVSELLVSEGERVPVGTPLAIIAPAAVPPAPPSPRGTPVGTERSEPAPEAGGQASVPVPQLPPARDAHPESPSVERRTRPRVSPLARVTAERLGVELSSVRGTGPNGAITQADVERAASGGATPGAGAATPAPEPEREPSARPDRQAAMRRAIAASMSRSHREIPHYYLAKAVDLSRLLAWLERTNRERTVRERVIPAALFVRAVALAAREVPEMNGHWLEEGFSPGQRVNVCFSVHVPGVGLIAPALLDADTKSLAEVMHELRDLVSRARSGALRSSELSEGTITITNLGERGGVDGVFGLINPPQVALVGFGSIVERPWAEEGMLAARRQVTLSLSADHRASDGHGGALFLAAVDGRLQHPEAL